MSHTELCVIFNRKPEVRILALVRSQEDARMFVEQKLATIRSGVELVPDESPRVKRWLDAEWTTVVIPEETQYVLTNKESSVTVESSVMVDIEQIFKLIVAQPGISTGELVKAFPSVSLNVMAEILDTLKLIEQIREQDEGWHSQPAIT